MRKALLIVAVVLAGALAYAFMFLPAQIESSMNRVLTPPPYTASPHARELLARATVVDLHGDSLLWGRDLTQRGTRGQVDIPRLVEGNVAVQAFTIVSKTPFGLNNERNTSSTDQILPLAIFSRWPVATWGSLTERALYQASRLRDFEARSGGRFVILRSTDDLRRYLERRATDRQITAGFLGIEGAQALDGKVENIDRLYDAGFRMMSPSHFFDTEFGGAAAGVEKTGLTDRGREMIRRMEQRHMLVDIAHAAPRTIRDVLSVATRPVVVSHTGVKGTCPGTRNLSDDELRGVAATGGVIGIAYFDSATCGNDAAAIGRAIRYAADVAGVEHVGLGSDFDGAVNTPFDTTGLALIVDALLAEKFSDDEILRILGGNTVRLLSASW